MELITGSILFLSLCKYTYIYVYFSRYSDELRTGRPGFDSRKGKEILFSNASRPALRPNKSPNQWIQGPFSSGIKWSGRKADHLPPSSSEVKSGGAMPPLPHTSSWLGASLIKHKENLTSAFTSQAYLYSNIGVLDGILLSFLNIVT
jgi:hypothetical protein